MQIQYYGMSTFKVTMKPGGRATEDVVIYFDPFEEVRNGLRSMYGTTDIILSSEKKNGNISLEPFKKDPVVFDTAGEYAVKGVNTIAFSSGTKDNNISFLVEAEDIKIAHLGLLREELTEKEYDLIGTVDILCLPTGGDICIDPKIAVKIAQKIEPAVILPMCYAIEGLQTQLCEMGEFYKEMGISIPEILPKLVLKKNDLEMKSLEVVHLEALH